jgi:spore coat polysaccharide biosynthesis predicted glycosyltransferase SpsG
VREYLAKLGKQVLIADNTIYDDFFSWAIGVPEIVNRESAASEIFVERKRTAFAGSMHIIMRQNFVPGISFHAKLEVAVPDFRWNALLHL